MDQPKRRSLLQKYDIPINCLDFEYIKQCTKVKELEKILKILQSCEEGYFPDLTRCAEDRLRSLHPNSKILRTEEKIRTKDAHSNSEWKELNDPLNDWVNDVRNKDKKLMLFAIEHSNDEDDMSSNLPPVRKTGSKLNLNTDKSDSKNKKVIKSTDYNKWDKYDAETEELKIEFEEERIREEVERKNRLNLNKSKAFIKEILSDSDLKSLSEVEKENLAIRYKERGNDFFRAKDYDEAINEYTQSILINNTAAGYNNRAMSYLKLQNYKSCIEDCNSCLELDPKNIKALLRKAQSFLSLDRRRDAYNEYMNILKIDSSNSIANNQIICLRKEIPDLPPVNATRIAIEENDNEVQNNQKNKKLPGNEPDLAQLIIPKKIIKNKYLSAMEKIENATKNASKSKTMNTTEKKPNKIESSIPQIKILSDDFITPGKSRLIEEL